MRRRKEGMRRDDDPGALPLERRHVIKGPHVLGVAREIHQEHVAAFDAPLEARNQDDASFGGVGNQWTDIELPIVQRDRQRVVAQRRRAVDQLRSGMRNAIEGIVRGMGVEFDFQHA